MLIPKAGAEALTPWGAPHLTLGTPGALTARLSVCCCRPIRNEGANDLLGYPCTRSCPSCLLRTRPAPVPCPPQQEAPRAPFLVPAPSLLAHGSWAVHLALERHEQRRHCLKVFKARGTMLRSHYRPARGSFSEPPNAATPMPVPALRELASLKGTAKAPLTDLTPAAGRPSLHRRGLCASWSTT